MKKYKKNIAYIYTLDKYIKINNVYNKKLFENIEKKLKLTLNQISIILSQL